MVDRHSIEELGDGTLNGLETELRRSLDAADSEETRYHIRSALQKIEVLREVGR